MILFTACITNPEQGSSGNQNEKNIVPYTEGIRISWDYSTLTRVYDGTVFYPRMIRLQNGYLFCAFESEGGIYVTRSTDEGANWGEAELVAPPNGEVNSAVPELIQLDSGRIILAYNTRPPMDNQNPDNRFGIQIRISDDRGGTWSPQQNVFVGGQTGDQGVWEPAMIQLKTGEIQLFFANEYPYQGSNDQEISMVRSFDNGETWTEPVTVSYRAGHRDGMPVPLILQDDKGIAVAIEDNGMDSGEFKPAIIWSSMNDNWEQGAANSNSDRRWRALAEGLQLNSSDYGGGPYLRQLPSGQTILSFQSTEHRTRDWTKSTMTVAIGNDEAKNFSRKSEPFNVSTSRSALWNSLFVKNDTTITAISSTTAYSTSGRRELYAKDGYIFNEIKALNGTVTVDGELNEEIWKQGAYNYLGSRSPASADISTAWDEEYLYIAYSVVDSSLVLSPDRPIDQNDGMAVMLATGKISSNSLVSGTYKIYSTASGKASTRKGEGGTWVSHEIPVEIASKSNNEIYQVELAIPWSEIGRRPDVNEGWGINFELLNYNNSASSLYREVLPGNVESRPTTWSKIELTQ